MLKYTPLCDRVLKAGNLQQLAEKVDNILSHQVTNFKITNIIY